MVLLDEGEMISTKHSTNSLGVKNWPLSPLILGPIIAWNASPIICDGASRSEMLLRISKDNKIPMSFIVGRLAKNNIIDYKSKLYNKYKLISLGKYPIFSLNK